LKGKDILSIKYNFTGQAQIELTENTVGAKTTTVRKEYIHDHQGRLLETKMKVDNDDKITVSAMKI
jgi:hypothetical protein